MIGVALSNSKKNPGYVTLAECRSQVVDMKEHVANEVGKVKSEVDVVKKALVGDDMRGGIVKDVGEIKAATSIAKTVVLPILLSVGSAVVISIIFSGL